jgi:hypothetical protein
VPGPQREIDQALERVTFLVARISREREALVNIRMSLKQSLDLPTEEVLDLAWLFGLVVSDCEDDELDFLTGSAERHPSMAEDAGMDLHQALEEHQVAWDSLEAVAMDEYRLLGKPIESPEVICRRDGTPLFPLTIKVSLVREVQKQMAQEHRRPSSTKLSPALRLGWSFWPHLKRRTGQTVGLNDRPAVHNLTSASDYAHLARLLPKQPRQNTPLNIGHNSSNEYPGLGDWWPSFVQMTHFFGMVRYIVSND